MYWSGFTGYCLIHWNEYAIGGIPLYRVFLSSSTGQNIVLVLVLKFKD